MNTLLKRIRFSLRALSISVTLLACAMGWMVYRAEQQRIAVAWIEGNGGSVTYAFDSPAVPAGKTSHWRTLVGDLLGPHYAQGVGIVAFRKVPPADGFEQLVGLSGLKYLECSNGYLSAEHSQAIGRMKRLEEIWLRDASFKEQHLSHLSKLPALRSLALDGSELTVVGLREVAKCKNLETLTISRTGIEQGDLASIAALSKLSHLDVSETAVSDGDLACLEALPKLTILELGGQITDAAIPGLLRLQELEVLRFYGSRVSDEGVSLVVQLPKLRSLWLLKTDVSGSWAQQAVPPQIAVQFSPKLRQLAD